MTVHPLLRQAMASAVVRKYPMALVVLVAVIDQGMTTEHAQPVKVYALCVTLHVKGTNSVRRGLQWLLACGYLIEHAKACKGRAGRHALATMGHDSPYSRLDALPEQERAA